MTRPFGGPRWHVSCAVKHSQLPWVYNPKARSYGTVTVCVAGIGNHGLTLVLASDRMISGLSQFQMTTPKIVQLTSSIAVMWSGNDASFQALIHAALKRDVAARIAANKDDWLTVQEVAFLYQHHYNEARRHRLEQAVLQPFGLTLDSFTASQEDFAPQLALDRAREIRAFRVAELSALIVGMDLTGPPLSGGNPGPIAHIYKFDAYGAEGTVSCEDVMGFASIGAGEFHAVSALMNAVHGPTRNLDETVVNVFVAKKRGEASPGVGTETDLYYFQWRPNLPGVFTPIADDVRDFLEAEYTKLRKAEGMLLVEAKNSLNAMVDKKAATSTSQATPPVQSTPAEVGAAPPPVDDDKKNP